MDDVLELSSGAERREGEAKVKSESLARFAVRLAAALMVATVLSGMPARAQEAEAYSKTPVLMEEATLRGKVVILETRKEDRHVQEGLKIQVWTTKEGSPRVKRDRIHETKTDEAGLFSLPLLAQGIYILTVGELDVCVQVVAKAPVRQGQEEPKVLLLMLPKEVI
jgi:hypothetical protein